MCVSIAGARGRKHPGECHLGAVPGDPPCILPFRRGADSPGRPHDRRFSEESRGSRSERRELKGLYYEVAHATKAPALDALKDMVPISQVLFGSDAMIRSYKLTTVGLDSYSGFSANDLRPIDRRNAAVVSSTEGVSACGAPRDSGTERAAARFCRVPAALPVTSISLWLLPIGAGRPREAPMESGSLRFPRGARTL